MPRFNAISTALIAIDLCIAAPAMAGEGMGCPVDPPAFSPIEQIASEKLRTDQQLIQVVADRVESIRDETIILTGHVIIIRGDQRIQTERAVYKKAENTIEATGDVHVNNQTSGSFTSQHSFLNLNNDTGFADIGGFSLNESRGRGYARRIVFIAKGRIKLEVVRFTTCRPENEDWYLKAKEIDINQHTATGTARHARLSLKGIPVFYTPYLSFPLGDHRRSGFLLPDFGSTDKMGTYVTLPYYWNIAPNYDATLKPRYMSNRGAQLQTEFRYLGKSFDGTAEFETLPFDAVTGDARTGVSYRHNHQLGPRLNAHADLNWVSDRNYFDDFATQLSSTSQSHLPQTLSLDYRRQDWRLGASLSAFQTIDKTITAADYPYVRLPQLTASWRPPEQNKQLNYQFDANATDFRHDIKESARRLHLHPMLTYPVREDYGWLQPRLSAWYTGYFDRSAGTDSALATTVASIDSGLVFERNTRLGGARFVQTLEPRVFYVYSPYINQDSLPLFDTTVPGFSFDSLFQDNRFIGADRVGDTHQATLALTSRLIDNRSGQERLTASLGQTFYLADRRVNVPSGTVTTSRSDVAGEISAWLGQHWYLRSSVQWDTGAGTLKKNNQYIQFQPGKDRILNIGYRFDSATQELVDVSTQWPLRGKWTFIARSQYSIKDRQNQDSFAGLLYDTCCWSLRSLLSRRVDQDGDQVNSFAFQVVLKGLAGFESGPASDMPLDQGVFN